MQKNQILNSQDLSANSPVSSDFDKSESSSSYRFGSEQSRLDISEVRKIGSKSISGRTCKNSHKTPEHSREKVSQVRSSKSSHSMDLSPRRKSVDLLGQSEVPSLGKRGNYQSRQQVPGSVEYDFTLKKLKITQQVEKEDDGSLVSSFGPNWWTVLDDEIELSTVIDIYESCLITLKEKKEMKEHTHRN